jgi:hypothetical protein
MMGNTHYAVVHFIGDLGNHPDPELNGRGPHLEFIAAGPEDFCWEAAVNYTARRPLQQGQSVEVLARNPALVIIPKES